MRFSAQRLSLFAGDMRESVYAIKELPADVRVTQTCERRRNDSSKTIWKYPRAVFSLYKSAELHTHRVSLPKQVYVLAASVLLLFYVGWHFYSRFHKPVVPVADSSGAVVDTAGTLLAMKEGQIGGLRNTRERRPMTKEEYMASYELRIEGLPHTASRYDELTMPADAPYPVGCYVIEGRPCKCVTQQGTPFVASPEFCQNFLASGFFKDWGNVSRNAETQTQFQSAQPVVY